MTVNLAVVGVGWAGSRHIEAIAELNDHVAKTGGESPIRVSMLVDPDEAHMSERAERFGVAETATTLEAALGNPQIDAVSIASPHAHHVDAAVLAAKAGKHVAVEKPMAVTVEEANRMINAADDADVKLFVTEQVAYGTQVRRLREIVESGEYVDEVTSAAVHAGFRADDYGYPGRRAWLAQPDHGGSGTWLLHGIHTVAAIRAVFGDVHRVYCVESKSPSFSGKDIEGTMSCLLEMDSGISIQLVQSCETAFSPDRSGTTVFGTDGTLFSGRNGFEVTQRGSSNPEQIELPEQELSDYALEFKAFAEWIESGAVPPTTGRHERGSLAVIQAGYESADSGEPIELQNRFGPAP